MRTSPLNQNTLYELSLTETLGMRMVGSSEERPGQQAEGREGGDAGEGGRDAE